MAHGSSLWVVLYVPKGLEWLNYGSMYYALSKKSSLCFDVV
jgi:hypothetical protein